MLWFAGGGLQGENYVEARLESSVDGMVREQLWQIHRALLSVVDIGSHITGCPPDCQRVRAGPAVPERVTRHSPIDKTALEPLRINLFGESFSTGRKPPAQEKRTPGLESRLHLFSYNSLSNNKMGFM